MTTANPDVIEAQGIRKETDSLGVVEVPADKLWGAQTQRSLEHFSIGKDLIPREMIASYAIAQTLLIGVAGFHKSAFGVDHVIKLIQSCTKTFEHSLTFPGQAIEMLAGKTMTTPASLCVLIQN